MLTQRVSRMFTPQALQGHDGCLKVPRSTIPNVNLISQLEGRMPVSLFCALGNFIYGVWRIPVPTY